MNENMEKINEFKIMQIEKRSRDLGSREVNSLIAYTCCALEAGFAMLTLNPIFLCAALGYLATAQMERHHKNRLKTDLKDVKSIKNENDFKKYEIKRIEKCNDELDRVKKSKKVYGVVAALALGGMFLAPAFSIVPLYVGIYGFITSKIREWTAKEDIENLASMRKQHKHQETNDPHHEPMEHEEGSNGKVKRKLLPAVLRSNNGGLVDGA